MNHKKILIILGISLFAAVVLLFVLQAIKNNKDKKAKQLPTPVAADTKPVESPKPVIKQEVGFPIKYNKFSEKAKEIQTFLGVKADGIIGDITLAAWKKRFPAALLPANNKEFQIDTLVQFNQHFTQLKNYKPAAVKDQLTASITDDWYYKMNPKG